MFLMFSESHEIPTSKPPISIRGSWTPRLSAACVRGVIPARVSVCVRLHVCTSTCVHACVSVSGACWVRGDETARRPSRMSPRGPRPPRRCGAGRGAHLARGPAVEHAADAGGFQPAWRGRRGGASALPCPASSCPAQLTPPISWERSQGWSVTWPHCAPPGGAARVPLLSPGSEAWVTSSPEPPGLYPEREGRVGRGPGRPSSWTVGRAPPCPGAARPWTATSLSRLPLSPAGSGPQLGAATPGSGRSPSREPRRLGGDHGHRGHTAEWAVAGLWALRDPDSGSQDPAPPSPRWMSAEAPRRLPRTGGGKSPASAPHPPRPAAQGQPPQEADGRGAGERAEGPAWVLRGPRSRA